MLAHELHTPFGDWDGYPSTLEPVSGISQDPHVGKEKHLPVVPHKAVAEVSKIGNL